MLPDPGPVAQRAESASFVHAAAVSYGALDSDSLGRASYSSSVERGQLGSAARSQQMESTGIQEGRQRAAHPA